VRNHGARIETMSVAIAKHIISNRPVRNHGARIETWI